MHIHHFYDQETATFTYVVGDEITQKCAVIDPVLNYDMATDACQTHGADQVIDFIQQQKWSVEWILETHIHADHLTAAQYIKEKIGGKTAIGRHVQAALAYWVPFFKNEQNTPLSGQQFDVLLSEETIMIGNLACRVLSTPGHTPTCVSYLIDDCIFVGDTIFRPALGTARTDFPGGSAHVLYESIQKILNLPESTKIYSGHDYPDSGCSPQPMTTVQAQKKGNILVHTGISADAFVALRNQRDVGKEPPRLLNAAVPFNLRAGLKAL